MKITKNPSEKFDFMKTIKRINKMNSSPNHLSKENIFLPKNQNDALFNESIPIKVRLMQAAHLNPNINLTQIKKINKTKLEEKDEKNKLIEKEIPKIISVKKNNFKKIKIISSSIKKKKENTDINNNSHNEDINVKIFNYITNNNNESPKENASNDNVDFEYKTYFTNITKSNYINKKTKNKFNNENKNEIEDEYANNKNILNTEVSNLNKGRGIFSSDNIFNNCKKDYFVDKSVNKRNESDINDIYNLNTFNTSNNDNISKGKINTQISVQTFNNTNSYNITNNNYKYIYLSPKNEKININKKDSNNDNVEIKLDDLILFEEKLNDIYIALKTKNVYEGGASDECSEFIKFYFHSSLKYNFTYFFNGMNKVIIKSAINLILYTIIISYHLSLNPTYLKKLNKKLKYIFSLSKLNLYLFIKKIQLFYGEKFTKKNDMYFRNFNYILIQKGIFNCNESKIVKVVNKNCYEIVSYLDKILDYYKSVENDYYQDFIDLFSSISKINEIDIHNYFYTHLFINSSIDKPKPKKIFAKSHNKTYENYNVNTETNENKIKRSSLPITKISDDLRDINALVENDIKLFSRQKNKEQEKNIILDYEKNRASAPFLKNKNQKKYTLVLDLEETLVHINQSGECILRPGLYQFLKDIKPYYELVSFSNESKYSSEPIIDIIEEKKKFFDYNLYREHLTFIGKEFIKDLSKLGRDIKKVIIVDNISNNFKLSPENGIQILPFFGDNNNDNILEELKKILILFYKDKLDDLRVGIRKYKKDIFNKITNGINK